jgi:hypothetical protein
VEGHRKGKRRKRREVEGATGRKTKRSNIFFSPKISPFQIWCLSYKMASTNTSTLLGPMCNLLRRKREWMQTGASQCCLTLLLGLGLWVLLTAQKADTNRLYPQAPERPVLSGSLPVMSIVWGHPLALSLPINSARSKDAQGHSLLLSSSPPLACQNFNSLVSIPLLLFALHGACLFLSLWGSPDGCQWQAVTRCASSTHLPTKSAAWR